MDAKMIIKSSVTKTNSNGSDKSSGQSIFAKDAAGAAQAAHQPFFVRKSDGQSSNSSHDGKSAGGSSPPPPGLTQQAVPQPRVYSKFNMMSINDLKSEKFSAPNSIIKERFFNGANNNHNYAQNNSSFNRFGYATQVKQNASNRLAQADQMDAEAAANAAAAAALRQTMGLNKNVAHEVPQPHHQYQHHPAHHHQNYHHQVQQNVVAQQNAAATAESAKAMQALQQIQEAKPGNKRAILTDLPEYLYSIPALASFFEPYGEVAMLQILPLQRMWDGDLIDLLGASMCTRLAQNTYCAIVEFYSARMAKFIIGILRKRLPILKFRCALLKPSAAIELTNQADNLALTNAVRLRHIPDQKKAGVGSSSSAKDDKSTIGHTSSGASSGGSPASTHANDSHSSDAETGSTSSGNAKNVLPAPAESPVVSSEESGLEEMSSSQARMSASGSSSCSLTHDSDSDDQAANARRRDSASSGVTNERQLDSQEGAQRFVTSFRIQLNR